MEAKKTKHTFAAHVPTNEAQVAASELRILAGAPLFKGLDAAATQALAGLAQRVKIERHAAFFRQGEQAQRFFVLLRGRIKVAEITPEGHQVVVRYAGAGDMFGCVSLYGHEDYPASATAATRCEALVWDCQTTQHLMEQFPLLAVNTLKLLGKELAELRARYRELATERVEQRVARALQRLVGQAGKKVNGGVLIEFPLSRQDLAELTGTTLHTVSRILSDWERQGIVESGRQRVLICNPHGLIAIAEDLDAPVLLETPK